MNNFKMTRTCQLLAAGALLLTTSVSHAQYSWVDAKGVKQFSDRPPPANIPQKNILRSRGVIAVAAATEGTTPAATTSAAPAKAAPTVAEREADYRKRQTEKAEADKKMTAEAADAKAKMSNCAAARSAKSALDSGVRIRDTGGDRNYMDDEQRAARMNEANRAINDSCN